MLSNGDLMIYTDMSADGQTYDCFVYLEGDVTVNYQSYQIVSAQGMLFSQYMYMYTVVIGNGLCTHHGLHIYSYVQYNMSDLLRTSVKLIS